MPNTKKKTKTQKNKKFYEDKRFWVGAGIMCAMLAVLVLFLAFSNKRHETATTKYEEAWDDYAEAQSSFGYLFGAMLGEMGFSTDGSTKYSLNYGEQESISRECARKVGIYNEVYNNPYAVKDEEIHEKDSAEIQRAVDGLAEFTEKINQAKSRVEECREIGEAKKKEIDDEAAQKEAEEKAEAEKQRQKEEAAATYRRNKLDYDKFVSQIREGMTLDEMRNVYGRFDSECKISTQSGGWVIYSCSPASASAANYWVASFTFYNGILKSKAQAGLE